MAHSFDTSAQTASMLTNNPVILSYTCGAGATLLVISVVVDGLTPRTAGTPTYNGLPMTDSGNGSQNYSAGETCVELWYLLNPPTGAAYNISLPNAGALSIRLMASSYKAAAGKTTVKDSNNTANGLSANPSVAVSATAGGVVVDSSGQGYRNAPTAGKTLLFANDEGNFSTDCQYDLPAGTGSDTMNWTNSSDDWVTIAVSFKEATPTENLVSTVSFMEDELWN